MLTPFWTRRDFSVRLASFFSALGIAGLPMGSKANAAKDDWKPGISRTAEAIRHEVAFKASPQRVYEAIMDDKRFSKVTGGLATQISRDAGGPFSLFGGQIKGRNVELVANERIVQAWRSEGWDAHVYSIASFKLAEQGSGTILVLDHTGFPIGQAEHLATGWKEHYWDSLEKYLAS
jgi:activator of HSP90 ATPase